MNIRDAWLIQADVEVVLQQGTTAIRMPGNDTRRLINEQDSDHSFGANEVNMDKESPVERPTTTSTGPSATSVYSPERYIAIPSQEKGTPENYVKPETTFKEEI
jgi:hypothetical protein